MQTETTADEAFIKAFEQCSIDPDEFTHADHIRMAWIYLRRFPVAEATQRIVVGIKKFAAALNLDQLYHDTITRFWIRAVLQAILADPGVASFSTFIQQNPELQNSQYIFSFYTREYLFSEEARQHWLEPDLPTEVVLAK